ncbi:hypothetical protein PENSPDRAFT_16701 [Peniophora sp. CONT]|nr:hypothetical protein PENSPDRAFT_16701 [Peniophora sp. CONT]
MSNYHRGQSSKEESGSYFPILSFAQHDSDSPSGSASERTEPLFGKSSSCELRSSELACDNPNSASLCTPPPTPLPSAVDRRADLSAPTGSPPADSPSPKFEDRGASSGPDLNSLPQSLHDPFLDDDGGLKHVPPKGCYTVPDARLSDASQSSGLPSPPPSPPVSPPSQLYKHQGNVNGCDSPRTGKRKALCIGINYYYNDEQGECQQDLESCVRDAKHMKRLLVKRFQFKADDVTLLTDGPSQHDPDRIPTKKNIIRAMKGLIQDAQPGDSLFFHYSGHGNQTDDTDGDEDDGLDEYIYPVDWDTNGILVDDDLHDIMVKPLPAGCRLTALYDSCHSGSVLDLPCIYTHDQEDGVPESRNERSMLIKSSQADVICWSACKDSESAIGTKKAGAMSGAFIAVLNQGRVYSYESLLIAIHKEISANPHFTQKPQLSSSHPIDIACLFTM